MELKVGDICMSSLVFFRKSTGSMEPVEPVLTAPLRYITLCYLNWLHNGELLNLEVQKKCLNYDDLCSKMHLFQALFLDF